MKKICILTAEKFPVPVTEGGAVENLIEMMADCYQDGNYDFSLGIISKYSEKSLEASKKMPKVNYHYIKSPKYIIELYKHYSSISRIFFGVDPVFLFSYLRKAVRVINEENYDVVVVENRPTFVEYLKKHTKAKIIPHLHNDYINSQTFHCREIVDSSYKIFTVSEYIKQRVETVPQITTPVVTVQNCIDTKKFCLTSNQISESLKLRKKLGFADKDVVCTYVGRVDRKKGVDKLIEAVKISGNNRLKLMVVGGSFFLDSKETPYLKYLRQLSDTLDNNIVFTGFIDYDKLPLYYYLSDIIIVPSQWDDPAPLTVFEAQACGRPLIVSNSGGIKEYVSNEVIMIERGDDFAKDLAQALNNLSKDEQSRIKKGRINQSFIAQYDKHTYLDRLVEALFRQN